MRINKFNPNYIMINFTDITNITFSYAKILKKEVIKELKNINTAIY